MLLVSNLFVSFAPVVPLRSVRLGLLGLITTLVGCGVDPESLATLEQAARQHIQLGQGVGEQNASTVSYSSDEDTTFQPAFPERRDPFRIDQSQLGGTQLADASSDIRVIGFAKLGQQQAIVKFGDESKFVIVGDRIGNVEVLGISPPRVRLRSGKVTWDASMFQNSTLGLSGADGN